MTSYGSDPIVAGIVAENRQLCSGNAPSATPTPPEVMSPAG
jgi:hypothetical protein